MRTIILWFVFLIVLVRWNRKQNGVSLIKPSVNEVMKLWFIFYWKFFLILSTFSLYLLLLISILWHRQAIFKSKGDKLSFSAECRIRTRVFGTESPADWMPADNPTELSRIKLKNVNSIARPYDQWAFSPLDPTATGLSHLAQLKIVFYSLQHPISSMFGWHVKDVLTEHTNWA